MFSIKEKHTLATVIEQALLELHHPEMPTEKPLFTLQVSGKESWSWAEIKPNWTFGVKNLPTVNPWNEVAHEVLDTQSEPGGGG